jgi:integrase
MAIQYIRDRKGLRWYVYAFKGGPRIHVHEGARKPRRLPPEALRRLAEAEETRTAEPDHLFRHVIREWQRSEDWMGLEPSTRRTWQGHVNLIETRWGEFPFTVWNDPRMAAKVVKWRDTRKNTPRAADIGVGVLRALLKWAKLNGYVSLNVAGDIPKIAPSSDREEIIWTQDDMEAFTAKAIEEKRPQLVDGLRLAALTGLRRADLVSLTFDHVGQFAVSKTALKKSRGKRRKATIPMTGALEDLLGELRTRHRAEGVNTVLVNSWGLPWSGDGFGGSFNRIRDLAGIAHEDGRKKHLHDVRGTFCTMLLAECGLTDEEAAPIMAWSKERIGRIRRVYVDDARVVVAIGERIAARQKAKHGAKHP